MTYFFPKKTKMVSMGTKSQPDPLVKEFSPLVKPDNFIVFHETPVRYKVLNHYRAVPYATISGLCCFTL